MSDAADRVVEIDGVAIALGAPVDQIPEWIGQREVLIQVLAAWSRVRDDDLPLTPRLLGKPGVGKTTLACAAARELELPIYIQQATMDTRPEDLIVSPVLAPDGGIRYVASPLVSAMVTGGAAILDEGNRMSEKSWASLAPLLDHRRYVESVVAGVRIAAHPEFRFATTMNEDASTYEIPEYIHSRLMPQIYLDFPEEEEERRILEAQVPFAESEVVEYVVAFLRAAHARDLRYTVRDGINLVRYAMKVLGRGAGAAAREAVEEAVELIGAAGELDGWSGEEEL
ncbi:MAG: AAA family ATPase [Thermoanaerobaculia bacterium]|nr:AAA family ATPase [Thermoanaerobaculia bacterium]